MEEIFLKGTAEALQKEWSIYQNLAPEKIPDIVSEETILKKLEERVVELLESGPESFFQLMYRIDISEKKLNIVLQEPHVASKIAQLIYQRQLQKIISRAEYKQKDPGKKDYEW